MAASGAAGTSVGEVGEARVLKAFADCKAADRTAFIPYVTSGFPKLESTIDVLLGMERGGADVIELGMPFSDPLADGGTIQEANMVALKNGITLSKTIKYVEEARAKGLTKPVILMGYANPFLRYGEAKLGEDCAKAGIDGMIVVDVPPEEAGKFLEACSKHSLAYVPLVAPTSTDARLASVAKCAKGYIYCVSVTGVTGARTELPPGLGDFLGRVRVAVGKDLPLAVGFGLSTHEHVKSVGGFADGAVMGSAVIRSLRADGAGGIEAFVRGIVEGPGAGK